MSKRNRGQRRGQAPTESRGVAAVTVFWMMSVMTTAVCGLVAALVLLAVGDRPDAEFPRLFGRLLHFSAIVSAAVSLVLLGIVLKVRGEPPPPAVTWSSVVIALLAIGAGLLY